MKTGNYAYVLTLLGTVSDILVFRREQLVEGRRLRRHIHQTDEVDIV